MAKEEVPVNTPIFDMRSPKTRSFLRMMNAVKKNPLKISDFLDDRIPAMKEKDVDASLLEEKPQGIKSDKEMQGAWSFLQMLLNRTDFGAMTPLEVVELYRAMNDSGLAYKEANQIKRQIKVCKHEINKKVDVESNKKKMEELQVKLNQALANAKVTGYSHNQRVALTQAVLIIGFIKEYVSLRAVRVENAEDQPVFIPLNGEDQTPGITINKEQQMVYLKPGQYVFYAGPVESVEQYPKATEFVPIKKKFFDKTLRMGEDMIDYVKIQISGEESKSYGYMEGPITVAQITAMMEAAKPVPLLTKEDVEKAEEAESVQNVAEIQAEPAN